MFNESWWPECCQTNKFIAHLLQLLVASTQITALSQSSTSDVSVWLPISPTKRITILHSLKNTKPSNVKIMPKPVMLSSMERQTALMQKEKNCWNSHSTMPRFVVCPGELMAFGYSSAAQNQTEFFFSNRLMNSALWLWKWKKGCSSQISRCSLLYVKIHSSMHTPNQTTFSGKTKTSAHTYRAVMAGGSLDGILLGFRIDNGSEKENNLFAFKIHNLTYLKHVCHHTCQDVIRCRFPPTFSKTW